MHAIEWNYLFLALKCMHRKPEQCNLVGINAQWAIGIMQNYIFCLCTFCRCKEHMAECKQTPFRGRATRN